MNSEKLKGKIVVVAGGSGQIGKHTVDILLKNGAKVINLDFIEKKLNHKNYFFYKIDLSQEKEIINFKKFFIKKFKKINILINHSHYKGNFKKLEPKNNFFSKLENYPSDEWKKTIDVNLNGMFYLTKHFIKLLIKNNSSVILNTSSTYGKVSPNMNIYGTSGINAPIGYTTTKSAIIGFTKYVATHYAKKGLRANILVPGGVKNIKQTKKFRQNYSSLTPMGRMARSNEYKHAVLFLVTEDSSYMNGSELIIDGGWTAW